MTTSEEKQQLRSAVRTQARQLPVSYRADADREIADRFFSLPYYRESGTVFCFVSTRREINTLPILRDALARGKTLCVPRCTAGHQIELCSIRSLEELSPGSYGILEPAVSCPLVPAEQVDLAVIPCLACSRAGQRLGQGGGYYDRFLSTYRGMAVMLCRERQLQDEIPLEPHDFVIPCVLTESGLFQDGTCCRPGRRF